MLPNGSGRVLRTRGILTFSDATKISSSVPVFNMFGTSLSPRYIPTGTFNISMLDILFDYHTYPEYLCAGLVHLTWQEFGDPMVVNLQGHLR